MKQKVKRQGAKTPSREEFFSLRLRGFASLR
jgi:hypothetical protein